MAMRELHHDGGGASGTDTISSCTPVSGRLTLFLFGVEDADESVLTAIDGAAGGWAVANGATWGTIRTSIGTNVAHSFVYCIPGSSEAGAINITFDSVPSRWQAFVLDWDDGDVSNPINVTDITHSASAGEAVGITHPAMDDSTNNMLVSFITTAGNTSATLAQDANYTESTNSPIAFESDGGAAMGVCWIVGGGDLICNWTWTGFGNYIATIFEVKKAAGGTIVSCGGVARVGLMRAIAVGMTVAAANGSAVAHTRAVGQAETTVAAQGVSRVHPRTETPGPIILSFVTSPVRVHPRAFGETETTVEGQGVARVHPRAIGSPEDTALSVGVARAHPRAVGAAATLVQGAGVTRVQPQAIGTTETTVQVQGVGHAHPRTTGETDTTVATAGASRAHPRAAGQATTGTIAVAAGVSRVHPRAVGEAITVEAGPLTVANLSRPRYDVDKLSRPRYGVAT